MNEFCIRMALGTTHGQVLQFVFTALARNVIGGVACGLLLSLMLRVLSKWAEGSGSDVRVGGTHAGATCVFSRSDVALRCE